MKKPLIFVNLIAILIGISYGMHGPILPVFAKNVIDASYAEIGLIGFANFIPYMFIPLFVGFLLHRFNSGYLLSIGVVINSAAIFLLSIAESVPEIMGFRVMTGIAHAFFWPPSESIISQESSGHERVKNISWFTGFFVAGFMIGPLLGSVFLEDLESSYRFLFEIASYVLISAVMFSMLLSRGRVRKEEGAFSFSSIKQMKKFPEVIVMLIYCTASFGMILTVFPAFLNDRSMSGNDILILFFIFGISRLVALGLGEFFARRTSITLIGATFAVAFGLIIAFSSDSLIEFAVSMLLMGFGFSIFFPLTLEIILSKTKSEIHHTLIGAYETTFGIGWVIGPIAAGLISEFSEIGVPYLVFFILGLGIAALSIAKRKALEPKRA
jgi:MFS family permease